MDAYLKLAEVVLRTAKRPLSPRAILKVAYLADVVPPHLFGKTQHKTLQARISEDILIQRERSLFFRTAPGRFFLREFITDASLPNEHRSPIVARRRVREWFRGPALAFKRADILSCDAQQSIIDRECVYDLINTGRLHYVDPRESDPNYILVCSFVALVRNTTVLSYRVGRYRESRDSFANKRSLGFYTLIHPTDPTLFNPHDAGILEGGLRAARLDLDLFDGARSSDAASASPSIDCFMRPIEDGEDAYLISLITYECPDWFEPLHKRLALNNLEWLDLRVPVNHIDDFEPWSASVRHRLLKRIDGGVNNNSS